jgi:hypothetical protein
MRHKGGKSTAIKTHLDCVESKAHSVAWWGGMRIRVHEKGVIRTQALVIPEGRWSMDN